MLYLFHGPETFLASLEIQKIAKNCALYKSWEAKDLAPASFLGNLRCEILQDSLLEETKLLVVQNFLSKETLSLEEKWISIFLQSKDTHKIIIWEKDKLPGKKTKLLKFLLENAEVRQFQNLSLAQAANWMQQRAVITPEAIKCLILLHGNNLWLLDSELSKLTTFANGQIITEAMVQKLCASTLTENIFELTDALGERKSQKALKFLNRLLVSRVEAVYILSMLARQLRLLALAQTGGLQKEHPFVQKKALAQSKNWQFEDLQQTFQDLTEIDYQAKIGADLETKLTLFLGKL